MSEHQHEGQFETGVMVDVGDGAGALVIYAPDELLGHEIEISPDGNDTSRSHTDVLRRRIAGGHVCAAVFGSLPEGEYRLWHKTLTTPVKVLIAGGKVTELDWR
jgi:hypothetical protein